MQIIATLNFKGGVGKTTVTWLLPSKTAKDEMVDSLANYLARSVLIRGE